MLCLSSGVKKWGARTNYLTSKNSWIQSARCRFILCCTGRSDFPVPLLVVGNLLSIYCGLHVFQSNRPQAVWKMATTSSWSTYTQPRVALEMGGLKPAACSALGISGNLIPSSLGLKCEKPHALAFHPVLYESSARSRFTIPQGTQSVHVGVSSLWSKAVTPAVWSWCMEQGERFSFKNSLF